MSDTPWLVSAVDTAANVVHDEATRGGGVVGPMGWLTWPRSAGR